MFTINPFAELSSFIPPIIIQTYTVVMIFMVAGGTLFDIIHKKSALYFFRNWRNSNGRATRQIGTGKMTSLAIQTAVVEVLASGEFCNVRRRIAHILTFYGFLVYIVTTVILYKNAALTYIVQAVQHVCVGVFAVASGTSKFLVIGLYVAW